MREHNIYAVAVAWQIRKGRMVTKAIAVIAADPVTAVEQGRRFAASRFPGVPSTVSIQELPPEVVPDRVELLAEVAFLQRENQALRDALRQAQEELSRERERTVDSWQVGRDVAGSGRALALRAGLVRSAACPQCGAVDLILLRADGRATRGAEDAVDEYCPACGEFTGVLAGARAATR